MTAADTEAIAGKVARGLGWSTVSNLLIRIGNFAMSLVMARLIAPDEFGVFAVALTVWTICGTLAEFGLGTDLIRATDVERRIPTVATLGLVTSGLLAASMALAAGPIAEVFRSPDSTGLIRLMSISMLLFGLTIVPGALLQRAFRQRALFAVNGTALLVSAGTTTVLALLGHGPMALAWGQIASQLTVVIGQYAATRIPIRLGWDPTVARESARFCLPLASANLLSWLLLSIDNLIVARAMSPTALGFYALAFNVSSWPMSAIGQSLRVVALPAFARLHARGQEGRALIGSSGPAWSISVLMGVVLGTMAVPVVRLLYGERWVGAAAALAGLAAFGALRVIFDLLATFLIAVGATRAVLAVQVWWLVVMIPAMFLGVRWFGLAGAGWTHFAVALGAVLPAYLVCLHRVGVDWVAFLRSLVVPTVCAVPAAVACWFVAQRTSSPVLALTLGAVCVLVLYVAPMAPRWLRQVKSLRVASPA